MKKKLLLMMLMVVAAIAVFAISAFAEGIIASKTESEEYGTVIQLSEDPGLDNAAQYASTLKDINDGGTNGSALCILTDGTYFYVFPSSYVVNEREDGVFDITATDLAEAMAAFNTANSTNYYAGYTIASSGAAKRIDAVVRFEFPSDVTSASSDICCMRSYPKLVEVRINNPFDFSGAEKMFYSSQALAKVDGLENSTGLAPSMFMFCKGLGPVSLPTNVTEIPEGMFFSCGTSAFGITNLAECTQLTTIGDDAFRDSANFTSTIAIPDSVVTIGARAFQSCRKAQIVISPTSKLQVISDNAFTSCTGISTIYIPSTVVSIGAGAFSGCSYLVTVENFENCQITEIKANTFDGLSKLTTLKIPETVTSIENAFIGNKGLRKVYIPKSVTTIADTFVKSAWENPPANIVFVYTGDDLTALSNCTMIANANVISLAEYDDTANYTGVNVVVDYSHCVVYNNGNHTNELVDVTLNSYLENGTALYECSVCGATKDGESFPALFIYVGCSTPQDGRGEMTIGFVPNYEAIDEYEKITGKSLRFGVFAAEKNNLGESDIFDKDGNAPANVIFADLTEVGCAMFDLRIVGFNTAELKTVKLAMGAFVAATKDAETQYFYLQEAAPSANEKYYFVSYNDVANRK